MHNRYFFDKRVLKKFFIKYGIMLLIAIPVLIAINVLFEKWFGVTNMIFLDLVFLCVIVVIGEFICYLAKRNKENKSATKEKHNEK